MAETMERPPVQGARFELPVSAEAKAAGVTGAIVEKRRPGFLGETVSSVVLKALFPAGRRMQAPHSVAEQERAQFEARKPQERQAPQ